MAKSCLLTGNEEQEAFKSSWKEFSYSQVHDFKKNAISFPLFQH